MANKKKLIFDPKKADRDNDGKLSDWEKGIAKKITGGKKAAKKAAKKAGKKKVKKIVGESTNISNFVTAISTKNYAEATKYLTAIVNNKIRARISEAINEPLF